MAEQKTTAASPEKGLAAVVLAPQTGLEPAAFRLGAEMYHFPLRQFLSRFVQNPREKMRKPDGYNC